MIAIHAMACMLLYCDAHHFKLQYRRVYVSIQTAKRAHSLGCCSRTH